MNHRRVTLLSCLALTLLTGSSVFGQDDVRALFRQIEQEKDNVPASVIRDLAKIGTPESWEALYKSAEILKKPNKLNVAYLSFKHFNGKSDLEKKSVDFLMDEINSQSKVSLARLAVSAMQGLMPSAEKHLLKIAESHEDSQCRALALKPLMSYIHKNRTSKTLFLLLDNFIPKKSGKSIEFVESVELFPLLKYRNEVKKRLLDEDYPIILKLLLLEILRGEKSQGLEDLALLCLDSEVPSIVISSLQVAQSHGLSLRKPRLSRLGKHEDPAVRMTALVALAESLEDAKQVDKQVSRWAKSRDPVQRQAAANAYGLLAMEVCVPGLEILMRDNSFAVRHDALHALQQLRHPAALEALIGNLDQGDKMTSDITQRLLSGLTGERFGQSRPTWSRWWEDHRVGFVFPTKEEAENRLKELSVKSSEGDTGAAFFGLPVVSQRVAFVIDTSSSMLAPFLSSSRYGGNQSTRLSVAKKQLLEALEKMPNGARFNIFNFDLAGEAWEDSLVKLNRKTRLAARKHIKNLSARGATAMFDALELAFGDQQVDMIFLLSDGIPSGGEIDDPDLILNEIRRWNMTRRIQIHCISIGGPTSLLEVIAKESSGNFLQVK